MTRESAAGQAERAALVQRYQLDVLHLALQSLQRRLDALERESARQTDEVDELVRQVQAFRAEAGFPPAEGPPIGESRSDRAAGEAPTVTPNPLVAAPLPDPGRSWDDYTRNVERYIADHGIEVGPDPLAQLLPPHRAAEIRAGFHADFRPAPWDRWDWAAVALAATAGALTDYLLVATPGGSFKGEAQRGSPLTAWMKEQSRKLAPINGSDHLQRNAFQEWIAKLTTAAEGWAKVPYDVVSPKLGLTPNVHRLASLGHDPLLGLVFGVGDILSGTCTFIDKSGGWRVIDHPGHGGASNPLEALVRVVVHGFSDVFTPRGLPPPFMAPFQLVGASSRISLQKGGDPVPVRHVARYMYADGYDLRHFMTAAISPAIAEIILCAYHGVRTLADGSDRPGLPETLKRERMLALTHGLLAGANVLKTALYGWNPMAINLAQFHALAMRTFSLAKLVAERDRQVRRELEDGWERLVSEARALSR